MAFSDFIERSLYNRRGYKYNTYQTEFRGSVFVLIHYRTVILKVDLDSTPPKVIHCNITSISDNNAVSSALWRIGINQYYITYRHNLYYIPANVFENVYLNIEKLNYNYAEVDEIIDKHYEILNRINKLNKKLSFYTALKKADFITECLIEGKISEIEEYIEKAEKYIEISKKAQETIENYSKYYKDRIHTICTLNGIYIIKDEHLIFVSEDKLDVYHKSFWYCDYPALGKLLLNKNYSEIISIFVYNEYHHELSELDLGELIKLLEEIRSKVSAYYRKMLDNQIAYLTLLAL